MPIKGSAEGISGNIIRHLLVNAECSYLDVLVIAVSMIDRVADECPAAIARLKTFMQGAGTLKQPGETHAK